MSFSKRPLKACYFGKYDDIIIHEMVLTRCSQYVNAIKPGSIPEKLICFKPNPNTFEKTQNHNLAIEALKGLGYPMVNIGPSDLMNGTVRRCSTLPIRTATNLLVLSETFDPRHELAGDQGTSAFIRSFQRMERTIIFEVYTIFHKISNFRCTRLRLDRH
jgi:hypothetical protein